MIQEQLRIAGQKVACDRHIEVFNPFTNAVVGTVPKATVEEIRRAFAIAKGYKATLTRHDRYRILYRAAEIIRSRTAEISDLITAECGICKKDSLYEVGRATGADVTLIELKPEQQWKLDIEALRRAAFLGKSFRKRIPSGCACVSRGMGRLPILAALASIRWMRCSLLAHQRFGGLSSRSFTLGILRRPLVWKPRCAKGSHACCCWMRRTRMCNALCGR
jgi:hypothetical protein